MVNSSPWWTSGVAPSVAWIEVETRPASRASRAGIPVTGRLRRDTRRRLPRMSVVWLALGFVFVQGMLWPGRATGSLIIPAALAELADDARAIVHGRVTAVRPQWTIGRRGIESHVTIAVSGYLKGDLGSTVTLRTPGGTLGAYRTVVVGAPVFREGDEVVLFLGSHGPSIPFILGLGQGAYRVVPEAGTGRRVVKPVIFGAGATSRRLVRGDPGRRSVSFQEFSERLRQIVAGLPVGGGQS